LPLAVRAQTGNTLYVNTTGAGGAYTKIQDAIDAAINDANPNDTIVTILVAAGTYHESLVWRTTRTVTLQGVGPGPSIIDPSGPSGPGGRCLHTYGNNSYGSKIDGFTFLNGSADSGGGMYNESIGLHVSNCTFRGNTASVDGGGLYNAGAAGGITGCTFIGNQASSGNGGGMFSNDVSMTITNCAFTGNTASSYGGGMYVQSSYAPVTGCTFTGNAATSGGGGLYNNTLNLTVTNCAFIGNAVINGSVGTVGGGGGMFNDASSPTITNCTFSGNKETNGSGGGGMFNWQSSPTVINCIVWGNTADYGNGGIDDGDQSSTTLSHTDSQDITDSPQPDPNNSYNFGAIPEFVRNPNIVLDSSGVPDLSQSDLGDLHLQKGSPCIDQGDNGAVAGIPADLDGNARIVNGGTSLTVDLGAYEHPPLDTIAPTVTAAANKSVLPPNNGKLVPVVVSGSITDNPGGSGIATAGYTTVDEYGLAQPSGMITPGPDGSYSFTVYLPASRLDSDKNGRTFTITVSAQDVAGNPASKAVVVTVPHDQGSARK
jgi:hypothetical protein